MQPDPYAPLYGISTAAELADMHPQTLRQYDRLGLVVPQRPSGGQRRYSPNDVLLLRKIQDLSRTGVSLEGIRRIVTLEREVTELRDTVGMLVSQLETIRAHTGLSRTFTAGRTGDVHTEFSVAAGETGDSHNRAEQHVEQGAGTRERQDDESVVERSPQSVAEATQKQLERVLRARQSGPRQLTAARRYAITWTGGEAHFTEVTTHQRSDTDR